MKRFSIGSAGSAATQRGAIKIKFLLTMMVLVTIVVLLVQVAPVYITDQQLQRGMKDEARIAAARNASEVQIQRDLVKRQEEYWVTLPSDTAYQIKSAPGKVEIRVDATIPINLFVTTYAYKINYTAADNAL